MDSHPEERPSKTGCFDRLSALPDIILEKILSFLPTKNVIGASILSKRWINLDPFGFFPIHLDLDDSQFVGPDGWASRNRRSFGKFVDKLFNETLRGVPCVKSMTLKCFNEVYHYDKQTSWVFAAIKLKVKALTLVGYPILDSLNGCTTLARLDLVSGRNDNFVSELFVSFGFSLPSLKRMYLYEYEINDLVLERLANACLALEELEIVRCFFDLERNRTIQSLTLKCLTIKEMFFYRDDVLNVQIIVPNLEVFSFKGRVPTGFDFVTFKSLNVAHIGFRMYDYDEDGDDDDDDDDYDYGGGGGVSTNYFGNIINACSSTKWLYISCDSFSVSVLILCNFHLLQFLTTYKALQSSSIQMPEFQNLTRLSLDNVKNDGWHVFASLLKNAPMLEHLIFEKEFRDTEFEIFERLVPSPPTCLKLNMKIVEFKRFDWKGSVVKLLKYFLQNGKVLEKVVLNSVVLPIRK